MWSKGVLRPESRGQLTCLLCGVFLVGIDQMVVAAAGPVILKDLGGTTLFVYLSSVFFMGTTVALPIAGRATDIFSVRRVFMSAVAFFLAASLVCALAPTVKVLIVGRALQGLAAGSMTAGASAIKARLFSPQEQPVIYSYASLVFGSAVLLGPLLGGYISEHFSWRMVFFINFLPGGVILFSAARNMPPLKTEHKEEFDLGGALVMIVWCLALLILTSDHSALDITALRNIALLLLIVVALLVFYRLEMSRPNPLFELSSLKNPTFVCAALAYFCLGGCMDGSLFFIPLYLNQAQGFTPTQAGAVLIAVEAGLIAATVITGRAVQQTGRYRLLLIVGSVMVSSFFVTAYLYAHYDNTLFVYLTVLAWFGFGLGILLPLYPIAVQAVVATARVGSATSAVKFSRQLGSSIGSALMGTLLVMSLHNQLPAQLPQMESWIEHVHYGGFEEKEVLEERLQSLVQRLKLELPNVINDSKKLDGFLDEYPFLPDALITNLEQGPMTESKAMAALDLWALEMKDRLSDAVDTSLAIGLKEIFLVGSILALTALAAAITIPISNL